MLADEGVELDIVAVILVASRHLCGQLLIRLRVLAGPARLLCTRRPRRRRAARRQEQHDLGFQLHWHGLQRARAGHRDIGACQTLDQHLTPVLLQLHIEAAGAAIAASLTLCQGTIEPRWCELELPPLIRALQVAHWNRKLSLLHGSDPSAEPVTTRSDSPPPSQGRRNVSERARVV